MTGKQIKLITQNKELLLNSGQNCACGETNKERMTVDHIVPMQILKEFGLTIEEMYDYKFLRIMCRKCNAMKANHLDFTDKRTKEILTYLINNY